MAEQLFGNEQVFGGEAHSGRPARPLWRSILRGFLGVCPNCGEGRLFRAFLKPVDTCEACGEDISHQRADDLPAYLVITIVGHVVLGGFLAAELMTSWSSWQHLAVWVPLTLILSLALLQPVKGAVIGWQWALYMHGFGGKDDTVETHPDM